MAVVKSVGALARLAGGFAESDPQPYVAEFLLGLAVLAAAQVMGAAPSDDSDQRLKQPRSLRM